MKKKLLEEVRIASPCSVSWEEMKGNEQKRFCEQCQLNVYNISRMTREEGEQLIQESEGRLCVRRYVRSDGTILTSDCPVGKLELRSRLHGYYKLGISLVFFLLGVLVVLGADREKMRQNTVYQRILHCYEYCKTALFGEEPLEDKGTCEMGIMMESE